MPRRGLLLAVIQHESGGNPDAMSWAGARGYAAHAPSSPDMGIATWGITQPPLPNFIFTQSQPSRRHPFLGAVEEQGGRLWLWPPNAGGGHVTMCPGPAHRSPPSYGVADRPSARHPRTTAPTALPSPRSRQEGGARLSSQRAFPSPWLLRPHAPDFHVGRASSGLIAGERLRAACGGPRRRTRCLPRAPARRSPPSLLVPAPAARVL